MIRVELDEEIKRRGVWLYRLSQYGLEGRSRQPLLDACRKVCRMDGVTVGQQIGMYRQGKDEPDLFCSVGVGAGLTVDEAGPYFVKWKPHPSSRPEEPAEVIHVEILRT